MLTTEQVRVALSGLADGEGRITPVAVVDAASDPGHPLHDQFEWDDSKAAQAHRIEQARRLIRSVTVVVTTEVRKISCPVYVRDPEQPVEQQGYREAARIAADPIAGAEMLRMEFNRALSHLKRAEALAEAYGAQKQVEKVRRQVEKVAARVGRVAQVSAA